MFKGMSHEELLSRINELKEKIFSIQTSKNSSNENDLEEAEMFRLLVEKSNDYIAVTKFDIHLTIEYLNPSYQDVLGYDVGVMVGASAFDFVDPRDKVNLLPKLRRYLVEKFKTVFGYEMRDVLERFEYRLRDASGNNHFVDCIAFNCGERLFFISRDNTLRVKIERDLKESQECFKVAAQSSSDLIYEWDLESNKIEWFGDVDENLMYVPNFIERTFKGKLDLLHPDDKERYTVALESIRDLKKLFSIEYRVKAADDSFRCWVDKASYIFDENNTPVSMVGVCQDVTSQRKALKDLAEHIEKLEKANTSMHGREMRIIELKDKIRRLEREINKLETK